MDCSIAMATRQKDKYLDQTLQSIRTQNPNCTYEIIVVLDDVYDEKTARVCSKWDVDGFLVTGNVKHRNPSVARNMSYKAARGDIIIAQSDEVLHHSPDVIERLCKRLQPETFTIAQVYNYCTARKKLLHRYTGTRFRRPFFFLGALWRTDLYAIGGCDEEFVEPGFDDDWFGACLTQGLGLTPVFDDKVIGLHQDHPRPADLPQRVPISLALYQKKMETGVFCSSGGPWIC